MSAINDPPAIATAGPAADALASVIAETIGLKEQVDRTLTLITELARRAAVHALDQRERADLTACAASVIPTISKAGTALAEVRERLRLASGLRRRS